MGEGGAKPPPSPTSGATRLVGRGGLDTSGRLAMTVGMISFWGLGVGRSLKALKHELATVQKRCTKLWAEMGAQEQEYVERKLGRAATRRCWQRYEALRTR